MVGKQTPWKLNSDGKKLATAYIRLKSWPAAYRELSSEPGTTHSNQSWRNFHQKNRKEVSAFYDKMIQAARKKRIRDSSESSEVDVPPPPPKRNKQGIPDRGKKKNVPAIAVADFGDTTEDEEEEDAPAPARPEEEEVDELESLPDMSAKAKGKQRAVNQDPPAPAPKQRVKPRPAFVSAKAGPSRSVVPVLAKAKTPSVVTDPVPRRAASMPRSSVPGSPPRNRPRQSDSAIMTTIRRRNEGEPELTVYGDFTMHREDDGDITIRATPPSKPASPATAKTFRATPSGRALTGRQSLEQLPAVPQLALQQDRETTRAGGSPSDEEEDEERDVDPDSSGDFAEVMKRLIPPLKPATAPTSAQPPRPIKKSATPATFSVDIPASSSWPPRPVRQSAAPVDDDMTEDDPFEDEDEEEEEETDSDPESGAQTQGIMTGLLGQYYNKTARVTRSAGRAASATPRKRPSATVRLNPKPHPLLRRQAAPALRLRRHSEDVVDEEDEEEEEVLLTRDDLRSCFALADWATSRGLLKAAVFRTFMACSGDLRVLEAMSTPPDQQTPAHRRLLDRGVWSAEDDNVAMHGSAEERVEMDRKRGQGAVEWRRLYLERCGEATTETW